MANTCTRCDEIVEKTERSRRAAALEMFTELARKSSVLHELVNRQTEMVEIIQKATRDQVQGDQWADTLVKKIVSPRMMDWRIGFGDDLLRIIEDYQAILHSTLDAHAYRELCTHGMDVPHEEL